MTKTLALYSVLLGDRSDGVLVKSLCNYKLEMRGVKPILALGNNDLHPIVTKL